MVRMYEVTQRAIKGTLKSAILRKNEKNDCGVFAIGTALNLEYDKAHDFCRLKLKRESKKGVLTSNIISFFGANKSFKVESGNYSSRELSEDERTNTYKLHGEVIKRKQTIASFMEQHKSGVYIITVSKHMFTIANGKLIDNAGMEYKPSRKVLTAFEINNLK
jgi:hypothetical protein